MFAAKKLLGSLSSTAEPLYVEDVFSTYLYTGTGGTSQTITNGIDLSGESGMVWLKSRNDTRGHTVVDTVRGANNYLQTHGTNASISDAQRIPSFTSSGFTLGNDQATNSTYNHVSWTFRKAEKFFDVVTYTGNGSNRTIAHNLGSVPGCIIVKRTDTTGDWQVYHRSLANTEYLVLNTTAAKATGATRWNSTTPTSTVFSLGTDATVNANNGTYVAYLFAHDAGGFGDAGDQSVIKCGSYTGNGSTTGPTIDLGWEPQWVLIKRASGVENWYLMDNMRGFIVNGDIQRLYPNDSLAEDTGTTLVAPTATGFKILTNDASFNTNGNTYIYIAIRRGPMKTPEAGTEVYNAGTVQNNTGRTISPTLGYPVDWFWNKQSGVNSWIQMTRLTGGYGLSSDGTGAEVNYAVNGFDNNTTFEANGIAALSSYGWMFRRAPGFFDVVCYTGTGSNRTVSHNLGVVPELIITKGRNAALAGYDWITYVAPLGNTKYLYINGTAAEQTSSGMWNNTTPTSSVFSLGNAADVNTSTGLYIAYLFASLNGISKIGSYTGNGSSQTINCGFTAGARFVLIKRTDSDGDWVVFDSARGIVSGNDPYLRLNSTAAEVTDKDAVDTNSTGFVVNETTGPNINTNGATYIYLAIS